LSGRSSSILPAATANAGRMSSASATSRRGGEEWRWLIVIAKLVLLRTSSTLHVCVSASIFIGGVSQSTLQKHVASYFLFDIVIILWYPCVSIIYSSANCSEAKATLKSWSSTSFLSNGCRISRPILDRSQITSTYRKSQVVELLLVTTPYVKLSCSPSELCLFCFFVILQVILAFSFTCN
jgi:hypothetical protein